MTERDMSPPWAPGLDECGMWATGLLIVEDVESVGKCWPSSWMDAEISS